MELKKAFAYLRVSGESQIEGDGFDRQEAAINAFAQKNNLLIMGMYREEGVSGALAKRPSLAELMVNLEQNDHGVKTVIIEKLDRLARDLMVQEAIISDLKKQGFELILASGVNDLISDDPTRKLVRQVLGAISEYDKTMTVLKLKAARQRVKAKTGRCEGRKPYSEAAPETLKEMKRLRRRRKGKPRMTYCKIAEHLNAMDYQSPTGKPFSANSVALALYRNPGKVKLREECSKRN